MNRDIKPIQGRQTPNLIGPECIEVTKVYDWVVLTNRDRNKVELTPEVTAFIQNCAHTAGSGVTANCDVLVDSLFCEVLGSRSANIPGVANARIVTLGQGATIRVTFTCLVGGIPQTLTQDFPVTFIDEVVLCVPTLPNGTIDADIVCRVFDARCNVVFNQLLGNFVLLEVVLCKEVQVHRLVKLEVEAKFCGPRQAIPIEEISPECIPFPNFPEQCPTFFPPENCLCQGGVFVNGTRTITVTGGGGGLAPATGNLLIDNGFGSTAIICDQCTLAKSSLNVVFNETPGGEPTVDQSFTFIATEFNQPTCTTTPVETLTVTGFGKFQLAGQAQRDVAFTLILNETTQRVNLVISDISGTEIFAIVDVAASINIEQCERF
jgi:hypothetical protein